MRVNCIKNFNFNFCRKKVFDSHVHIGPFMGVDLTPQYVDEFIKTPLDENSDLCKVLVSSMHCMGADSPLNEYEGNMQTVIASEENDAIVPLATCKVNGGDVVNIKKLFADHPYSFYGLKFHPDADGLSVDDPKYIPYFDFAKENDLPCLFHCAINWDGDHFTDEKYRYSDPRKIYKIAREMPNIPVIMAHMGSGGAPVHDIAVDCLVDSIENGDANLYADISWVDCSTIEKPNIIKAIKRLKSTSKGDKTDRLLFGSDMPIGEFNTGKDGMSGVEYYIKNITDIKRAIREAFPDEAEELIDKIFYKNTKSIFFPLVSDNE